MSQHNIFTISDIEMGKKDIFDDFKDEDQLIAFIKMVTNSPGEKTLILNGDTFDFLKMPYKDKFTHHITENISVWKTVQIIKSYSKVFQALHQLLNTREAEIYFIIGNHDLDIIWPKVQQEIKKRLNHHQKIHFTFTYDNPDLHIEHGNLVDYLYNYNLKKPFLKVKGKKVLNLPFASVAIIKYFIDLKKNFPFEEKIYPRKLAFEASPDFKIHKNKLEKRYIFKGLLYESIFKLSDPVSKLPYLDLIRHILSFGFETLNDQKFFHKRMQKIMKKYPHKKAYILGHLHLTINQIYKNNIRQIITNTWREEYQINNNFELKEKEKNYVQISYKNQHLIAIELKQFIPEILI